MMDECADLLEFKSCEGFVLELLDMESGEWLHVAKKVRQLGLDVREISNSVYAAWLKLPESATEYVLIVFFDMIEGDTLTATYNAARLARAHPTRIRQDHEFIQEAGRPNKPRKTH